MSRPVLLRAAPAVVVLPGVPDAPELWVDAGIADEERLAASVVEPSISPVLGSESQRDDALLRRFRDHPGLILLDLTMPVLGGRAFRRTQLADPALAAIPTVVCSGFDDPSDEAEFLGAAGFLRKPMAVAEVLAFAARYCGRPTAALTPEV